MTTPLSEKSWWGRTFGRSLLDMMIGIRFFEKKSNAASVVAIMLVFSICFVIVVRQKYEYMSFLLNIVFVVIGYYFGAKQEKVDPSED